MNADEKRAALIDARYPLAAAYDPDWLLDNEMGCQCLWLVEGIARKMGLRPGLRVLDLGCGKALTSIFLAREFGVQVFANDWWIPASDNWQRIHDAGVDDLVVPVHAEAHALPYADGFFDAAVCVNAYQFFGTADTYFNDYFGKLVQPGGQIGFALPGLYHEFEDEAPAYLREHWWPDFYTFHAFDWWQRHFKRTGAVEIETLDDFDGDGNRMMKVWEPIVDRMNLVRVDAGRNLSWIRLVLHTL